MVYAQTVVLATFMGGLAIGNRLFGRLADRLQHPVRIYGYLEIGIGIYAVLFPLLDQLADQIFAVFGQTIADRAGLLVVLKAALSAGLLLGPTILTGGTLPLMATWLQRSSADAGRRSARFYSVNSRELLVRRWPDSGWATPWNGRHPATDRSCKRPHRCDSCPAEPGRDARPDETSK